VIRRRGVRLVFLSCALAWAPVAARAQVSVQDLLDVQFGNAPGQDPSNLIAAYNRTDVAAYTDLLRVGAQFQFDHNSANEYPYALFTQRWLELSGERGRLRVGNTYTILGRGLLQRSFQVPGVVLTQNGTASRFGFSRDLDGVLLEGRAGLVSVRGMSGQPTAGDISPGFAQSIGLPLHAGDLTGGQLTVGPWHGTSLGAATMRLSPPSGGTREFASGFAEMDPLALARMTAASIPLYVEYALGRSSWDDWWRFHAGDDHSQGFYASTGLVWGPLGFSGEWKDYHAMQLGVNDPPSLVREQSYTLLNRTTHVLNARDERGYQFEGTWRQAGLGDLTLNRSHGDGHLVASQPARRFDERFAELHVAPGRWPWLDATVFADRARDLFVGAERRETYGVSSRVPMPHGTSAEFDLEHQSSSVFGAAFVEQAAALTLRHSRWGSAGVNFQSSTDPAEARPGDTSVTPRRTWWGGTVGATIEHRYEASLFVGQRRQGLACTAGTCYTVEALEGVAFRLLTRF